MVFVVFFHMTGRFNNYIDDNLKPVSVHYDIDTQMSTFMGVIVSFLM